jgi:hypothetical protein
MILDVLAKSVYGLHPPTPQYGTVTTYNTLTLHKNPTQSHRDRFLSSFIEHSERVLLQDLVHVFAINKKAH